MKIEQDFIVSYDEYFDDKSIKKGLEVYLSDKISDLNHKDNVYTCKIKGSDIYDVSVSFENNSDEVDTMTCTCPFAKEGSNCKHMYALLLKLKGNYNLEVIRKEVVNGINELTQIFNNFEKYSKSFKKKYPKYNKDIECVSGQMNCYKITYFKIVEKSKKNVNKIMLLKDIIELKKDLYSRLENFNEYIMLDISINSNNKKNNQTSHQVNNFNHEEEYEEYIEEDNSPGLFGTFMNVLDSVNKEQEKRDKEYEEEKQRYRRAIIEQNLYEGKNNEDMYDGLE